MLLTFDFKTVEEAQEFLAGLIAKPALTPPAPRDLGLVVSPAKDSAAMTKPEPPLGDDKPELVAESPAPEKKKRGPKPKAPTEPTKEYGIEDCRAALSALFDAKGRDAAKAALAEFKVERIGGLKPEQYRGFIVLCETMSQPE